MDQLNVKSRGNVVCLDLQGDRLSRFQESPESTTLLPDTVFHGLRSLEHASREGIMPG